MSKNTLSRKEAMKKFEEKMEKKGAIRRFVSEHQEISRSMKLFDVAIQTKNVTIAKQAFESPFFLEEHYIKKIVYENDYSLAYYFFSHPIYKESGFAYTSYLNIYNNTLDHIIDKDAFEALRAFIASGRYRKVKKHKMHNSIPKMSVEMMQTIMNPRSIDLFGIESMDLDTRVEIIDKVLLNSQKFDYLTKQLVNESNKESIYTGITALTLDSSLANRSEDKKIEFFNNFKRVFGKFDANANIIYGGKKSSLLEYAIQYNEVEFAKYLLQHNAIITETVVEEYKKAMDEISNMPQSSTALAFNTESGKYVIERMNSNNQKEEPDDSRQKQRRTAGKKTVDRRYGSPITIHTDGHPVDLYMRHMRSALYE